MNIISTAFDHKNMDRKIMDITRWRKKHTEIVTNEREKLQINQ